MCLENFRVATNLDHIINPFDMKKGLSERCETPVSKKVGAIVLFIFISIASLGIGTIFYLCTAQKKNRKLNQIQARQLNQALTHLKKFGSECSNNDMLASAQKIQIIQKLLENSLKVHIPSDHHLIHDIAMEVTYKVKENEKLKEIWKSFIDTMHGLKIKYSNNYFYLDFTPEKSVLNNPDFKASPLDIEVFDKKNKSDFKQIYRIDDESFSRYNDFIFFYKTEQKDTTVLIARDRHTRQIEGYVSFQEMKKDKTIYISGVARRANAAKRRVTIEIFEKLKNEYFSRQPLATLYVRKSNIPAHIVYDRFGFKDVKEVKNRYTDPKENGIYMIRKSKQK